MFCLPRCTANQRQGRNRETVKSHSSTGQKHTANTQHGQSKNTAKTRQRRCMNKHGRSHDIARREQDTAKTLRSHFTTPRKPLSLRGNATAKERHQPRPQHGEAAKTLQQQSKDTAITWQRHGKAKAEARQRPGKDTAKTGQRHGKNLATTRQSHRNKQDHCHDTARAGQDRATNTAKTRQEQGKDTATSDANHGANQIHKAACTLQGPAQTPAARCGKSQCDLVNAKHSGNTAKTLQIVVATPQKVVTDQCEHVDLAPALAALSCWPSAFLALRRRAMRHHLPHTGRRQFTGPLPHRRDVEHLLHVGGCESDSARTAR